MIIRVSVVQRRLFEVKLTDVSSKVGPYGPYRPSSASGVSTT